MQTVRLKIWCLDHQCNAAANTEGETRNTINKNRRPATNGNDWSTHPTQQKHGQATTNEQETADRHTPCASRAGRTWYGYPFPCPLPAARFTQQQQPLHPAASYNPGQPDIVGPRTKRYASPTVTIAPCTVTQHAPASTRPCKREGLTTVTPRLLVVALPLEAAAPGGHLLPQRRRYAVHDRTVVLLQPDLDTDAQVSALGLSGRPVGGGGGSNHNNTRERH